MAIIGPAQLPIVLRVPSDPLKMEVMSTLGHPTVMVEITEPQLEQAIRVTGDFIAQYFPLQGKYAYFETQPLVSSYPLPPDAYWVKDVKWDPATTRIGDIFGAETGCVDQKIDLPTKTKRWGDIRVGEKLPSFDIRGNFVEATVIAKKFTTKKLFKVIAGNREIITSADHLYLTDRGWKALRQITRNDCIFRSDEDGIPMLSKIDNITPCGTKLAVDFQIDKTYNFVASSFVIHNSFLFCYPGGTSVLTTHGPMLCESLYEKMGKVKVVTAFRPHKPRMRWNQKKQPITVLKTEHDFVACTPNHPVSCNGKFIPAAQCEIGSKLISSKDKLREIIDKKQLETEGTWSVQNRTGSMFISSLGKEFYLSH